MKNISTKKFVFLSMITAICVVSVYIIRFPIFTTAAFLEYDPSDIPIILVLFSLGPKEAFIITVVLSIIQGITVSAHAGIIGILMHILATGSYILAVAAINKRVKKIYIKVIVGCIFMTISMVFYNVLITPLYLNMSIIEVIPIITSFVIPFNIIKSSINSIIFLSLYKKLNNKLKF